MSSLVKKPRKDRQLLDLPEQVLASSILSRLHSPSDIASTSLVCRQLAHDVPLSVRHLQIGSGNTTSFKALAAALAIFPSLEALSISTNALRYTRNESADVIATGAAQHCPKLVSLRVCSGTLWPLTTIALKGLIQGCQELQEISIGDSQDMYACSFKDSNQLRATLTNSASGSRHKSPNSLPLPRFLAMEVGNFEMIKFITGAGKDRLKHLNLWLRTQSDSLFTARNHVAAAEASLDVAAQCLELESLRLSGFTFAPGEQEDVGWTSATLFSKLEPLGNLTQLKILALRGSLDKSVASSESVPLPWSFRNLVWLEELVLKNIGALEDVEASCHLPRLRHLTVSHCGRAGIPETIHLLTSLQVLRFRKCSSASFSVPETLGLLTQLQNLQLKQLSLTTLPDSMVQMQRLSCLDLSGCTRLRALPGWIARLEALKKLSICGVHPAFEHPALPCLAPPF